MGAKCEDMEVTSRRLDADADRRLTVVSDEMSVDANEAPL